MQNISTPEQVLQLLKSVDLPASERKKLNRDLANTTRRYFHEQIREQKDIYGKSYKPRRKRKYEASKSGKVHSRLSMFLGFSRMMKAMSDENGFEVGLAGLAGKIAKVHNDGETVTLPTRMHGWFNSKTNQWEGGVKRKMQVRMPERTFIGWTQELEKQITTKIIKAMEIKP
ncbi:phage virion morphogenesis protein [Hydrogenovibrio marinus]|uniref:Virion morphogenesis protein n=1 Tax=Hydrogenovibrio marinus TaxID=28885 RepID=A0A066ZM20_HYDMR|nr:phage virion morphogenesis protein [Hydrogenovibrio marinus]KDN94858.1 hypothetical protein EI16_00650 [Hydrogenovibrio marinus]BBN59318.1 hypothetical protein HVMH_0912 [Hydrogenovibrio marinus]